MSRLDLLTDALRACFGSSGQLAAATGCSERSALRYVRGQSVPNIAVLTRLMGQHRCIADAVLAMAGLDQASLDREADRLRAELAELTADYEALLAKSGAVAADAAVGAGSGEGAEAASASGVTP